MNNHSNTKDNSAPTSVTDLDLIMYCFTACLKQVVVIVAKGEQRIHAFVRGLSRKNRRHDSS